MGTDVAGIVTPRPILVGRWGFLGLGPYRRLLDGLICDEHGQPAPTLEADQAILRYMRQAIDDLGYSHLLAESAHRREEAPGIEYHMDRHAYAVWIQAVHERHFVGFRPTLGAAKQFQAECQQRLEALTTKGDR